MPKIIPIGAQFNRDCTVETILFHLKKKTNELGRRYTETERLFVDIQDIKDDMTLYLLMDELICEGSNICGLHLEPNVDNRVFYKIVYRNGAEDLIAGIHVHKSYINHTMNYIDYIPIYLKIKNRLRQLGYRITITREEERPKRLCIMSYDGLWIPTIPLDKTSLRYPTYEIYRVVAPKTKAYVYINLPRKN